MKQNIYKKVLENKEKFIPNLFTEKQVNIMEKYVNKQKLNKTEQTYFYSVIKKKLEALEVFSEEFYINGKEMINARIIKAKEILNGLKGKKAFISGSFLFKEKYNDIDIYVISKKRKQYHKEKKHFIFITEEDLKKPIYISALKYSVSNFLTSDIEPIIKRPQFDDLIMTYEGTIIEILDNDDQKELRELIFEYYIQVKNKILDSFELASKFTQIKDKAVKEKINYVNKIVKEIMLNQFSYKYVYNELTPFTSEIKKQALEYKANDNLLIYIDLFNEVKNECRRIKV